MIVYKAKLAKHSDCTGCLACADACNHAAIGVIKEGELLYPSIDKSKCVDCGMCKKVCPILRSEKENKKEIITYACYNKNLKDRINSSSGGIFVLLAKQIIKKNGVVFGATFDNEFNVKHSYIETEKDLEKFMGSKYTQSVIGDSYKKVKEFLEKNRFVLFTGTPCQIEGLKSFLQKDYDKLYTQDIICHGVPSPKLWKKYLLFQKNKYNEQINSISFRNKDNGWEKFQMKIQFDTKIYSQNHSNDIYMKAFLGNICLRDSCYNCSFKKKYRESDITLGDYWGVNNIHPDLNDDKGISVMIVNTPKGNELFEQIKEDIEYVETNVDEAIKYNSAMIKSVVHHKYEKEFMNNIDNMSVELLIKKYMPKPTILKRIVRKIKKMIK